MKRTYPLSLAGLYKVNFSDLVLTPIRMVDSKPNDYQLKQIRCEAAGLAVAEFDNGFAFTVYITFDKGSGTYFFHYGKQKATKSNPSNHSFQILSDLSMKVNNIVQVTSWVDLGQLANEEI